MCCVIDVSKKLCACVRGLERLACAGDLDLRPPPRTSVAHVDEIEPRKLAAQLFGKGDSFFWRVLAREPVYQPHDRSRGRRPFTGIRNDPHPDRQ